MRQRQKKKSEKSFERKRGEIKRLSLRKREEEEELEKITIRVKRGGKVSEREEGIRETDRQTDSQTDSQIDIVNGRKTIIDAHLLKKKTLRYRYSFNIGRYHYLFNR